MRRALYLVMVAALAALALPSAASAVVTCAYDSGAAKRLSIVHSTSFSTVTVRLNDSDPNNVRINVLENGVLSADAECTDVLRSQTDTVAYDETDSISAVVIEEPDDFTPAFGSETPPEQSEVNFAIAGSIITSVALVDTDNDGDNYQAGTNGINYNIGVGDSDVDITLPIADLVLDGGSGDDIFDATGGGTGAAFDEDVDASAGGGADTVLGGTDGDTIEGGSGDDFLRGGSGPNPDEYNFTSSATGVRADLSVVETGQNTGSQGVDDIAGFEDAEGTEQADVLRGDGGPNSLDGNGGDDTFEGRGGNDNLSGNAGSNTASYASAPSAVTVNLALTTAQNTVGAGTDTFSTGMQNVIGSAFDDDLQGSAGPNTITGGAGTDTIQALAGVDRVEARDTEADTVDCGLDADTGVFDLVGVDTVSGCETSLFFTPAPAAKPKPTVKPADRTVELIVSATDTQRIGSKGVAVKLECPKENCTVKASASLKEPKAKKKKKAKASKTLKLKGTSLQLQADKPRTVRLKLSGKNLRRTVKALRKKSKRSVSILATATDAAGNKDVEDDKVKLKAPPKPKKKKRG